MWWRPSRNGTLVAQQQCLPQPFNLWLPLFLRSSPSEHNLILELCFVFLSCSNWIFLHTMFEDLYFWIMLILWLTKFSSALCMVIILHLVTTHHNSTSYTLSEFLLLKVSIFFTHNSNTTENQNLRPLALKSIEPVTVIFLVGYRWIHFNFLFCI